VPIPARSFYFLRHGQTAWNVEGRFQGHADIPLNELGLAQAHDAARILARCPIDIIVASPLVRARKTAEVVSEQIGKPLLFDDELKERPFGAFEGLVVNEVKAKLGVQPHQRLVKHLPPDAEQWHETCARAVRVLGKLAHRSSGSDPAVRDPQRTVRRTARIDVRDAHRAETRAVSLAT